MNKRHVAAVLFAAGLLAVGCSSSPSTQPPGAVRTPSASSAFPGASSAPKVADPLPASVFDKHPCDIALTPDQLKQLISEAPPSHRTDNAAGPGCGWTRQSTGTIIEVAWLTGAGSLSEVIASQEHSVFHQQTEVDGYPALYYNPEEQPTEICHVAVGIADNLVFEAAINALAGKVNRCDAANQIAEKVLTNLKAAAGK